MTFGSSRFRGRLSRLGSAGLTLGAALACGGQAMANPFAFGPVDANSPVAADVAKAQREPGPYPSFVHVPPVPRDVRPASAWRAAVYETWGLKQSLEAEAAAIPFTLAVGQAGAWAAAERAKIPAAEMTPPPADTAGQAEAFAETARARATPPPPPK